jgi:hypothetical protein
LQNLLLFKYLAIRARRALRIGCLISVKEHATNRNPAKPKEEEMSENFVVSSSTN